LRSRKIFNHEIVEKAWCDKTDFDDIYYTDNLKEDDVKKILKKNLKRKSYIVWRKRISKVKANKKF
tara:strand:- start:476 stop:673 length:198 start_codon:yes stop_codon:yes gene_type:complete